jgi:hypothetical protein
VSSIIEFLDCKDIKETYAAKTMKSLLWKLSEVEHELAKAFLHTPLQDRIRLDECADARGRLGRLVERMGLVSAPLFLRLYDVGAC